MQTESKPEQTPQEPRQAIMRTLALADSSKLEEAFDAFEPKPEWSFLRKPETGLVMVRGRIGGGGAPFNLGEMSVTRAAIALKSGETGHAYVAGRDQRKAAIAALVDAMWQREDLKSRTEDEIIAPLERAASEADASKQKQAEATRVDFFTMVRGDD